MFALPQAKDEARTALAQRMKMERALKKAQEGAASSQRTAEGACMCLIGFVCVIVLMCVCGVCACGMLVFVTPHKGYAFM